MNQCWRCQHELTESDKYGSSHTCPTCGGVTKTGQRPASALPAAKRWIEVGNRNDWEKGIRTIFMLPAILVCPLVAPGLLKTPGLAGAIAGGCIGGMIAYALAESLIRSLRFVWPPKKE